MQSLTAGAALEARAFSPPSAWEHQLDYTADPEQPDQWEPSGEPDTLSPDPADRSKLQVELGDLRIDWTERFNGHHFRPCLMSSRS